MKRFLFALIMIFSVTQVRGATQVDLTGNFTWDITEPRCTFDLDGGLSNNTSGATGTLKVLLWLSQDPFPAPGYSVAESIIGQIGSGQAINFNVRAKTNIPAITGSYHFTIVVAEFNNGIFVPVLRVATGTRLLQAGNFVGQVKWTLPVTASTPPPAKLLKGDQLKLTVKASEEFNEFPLSSQTLNTLVVKKPKQLTTKTGASVVGSKFNYVIKPAKIGTSKVSTGQLTFTPRNKGKSVINLFFQGPNSGIYKRVEATSYGLETTWGSFTFN